MKKLRYFGHVMTLKLVRK